MIYHMSVSIDGIEDRLKSMKKHKRNLWCIECFSVSEETLLKEISKAKEKGWSVLPSSECNDHIKGQCNGHNLEK